MSLLMDALNKAEQAKRQNQAAEAEAGTNPAEKPASPPLALELTPLTIHEPTPAIPETPQAPPALPELPSHLGMLDEEFIAHATSSKPAIKEKTPPPHAPVETPPAPPPEPAPAAAPARNIEAQQREAVQNMFDAKQPRAPASKRKMAIVIGSLTLLAGIGIGVYFWLQLQPRGGLGMAIPAANIPRPPAQPVQAAPPAAATTAQPTAAAPATPSPVPPLPAVAATAARAPRPAPAEPAANDRNEAASPIRLSTSKLVLNPALARGYEAYMAGDLVAAGNEYLQVLKNEPTNLDALHGMAAISLRRGQADAAGEYYLRAIEADPKDALAQVGLIGLKGQTNPLQAESRLKSLLAAQPDLPYLNFALGSLYASQNRWNEAQAAFFKAYSAEPENPDTLCNLAISLDRLRQPKLALHYYNLALTAAANRPASFDKAQVNSRLRELQ